GELALAEEAPTGNYTIQAAFDGNPAQPKSGMETYSASFLVAEFRKPDFEVKVSSDKKEYIQGDDVAISAGSNYFFGAPMADAKVTWQVFQKPYEFEGLQDVVDGPFSFSDHDEGTSSPTFNPGPRPIASGEGRTDDSGAFTFRLRSDIAKETMGQNFTFEVMVTDANNQQVVGRSEATIHKGTFYIGVRPRPRVVAAGKSVGIDLITENTQAFAVSNKAIDLQLFEQKWYSVQEKGPDGRFSWTSKVDSVLVSRATTMSDGEGKANTSLILPKAGSYKILATGKDERGNEVRSSTYVYASGSDMVYWKVENNDRIDLIADKPSYKPGETAKVLIPSPFPKAKALLTIERGHIMSYQTLDINSTSQVVEIPVESAHVPNVYVSIVLLRSEADGGGRADFKMGYVELPVRAD
ncbi:MAG: hypothetical protein Q7O66_12035, partial [Dehalococcoidia bacterium]|nr:hypothetical protein [Dehalococcoidia bacterium]